MELWVDLKLEPQGAAHAPRWWSDPSLVQATVDAIEQSGLWLGFERVGAAGGNASAPFSSAAELARESTRWASGVYDITGPAAESASSLRLSLDPDELRVQLFVGERDVEARRATLLGSVCDAIALVRTALENVSGCAPATRWRPAWSCPECARSVSDIPCNPARCSM